MDSLFLSRIMAELDAQHAQHAHVSEQELCAWLCARVSAAHLAELRALLFGAASRDPHFPATLFRDKMRAPGGGAHCKRRVLAADVVAMFKLLRAREQRERAERRLGGARPPHRYADPPLPEAWEPDFLLEAAPLDKVHHLPRYSPSCPPPEPRPPGCLQKKNDFGKMAALRPQAAAADCDGGVPGVSGCKPRRPGPAPFFARSSEAAYGSAQRPPGLHERRRVKRESLHDLQAPAACQAGARHAWAVKSFGLNVDDQQVRRGHDNRSRSPKWAAARAESADGSSGRDAWASVGTQTESGGRKGAGSGAAPSDEDSEPTADDISDMFRFLDEMSVCDSPGVVASSCYDSAPSLGSDSGGESLAERGGTVRLARWQLDRLLRSLAARMGHVESKLESLAAVRGQISQVLSELNALARKMQPPPQDGGAQEQDDAPGSPPPPRRWHADAGAPHVSGCRTPAELKKTRRSLNEADAPEATPTDRRSLAHSARRKHAGGDDHMACRDKETLEREHRYHFCPRLPEAAATERRLPTSPQTSPPPSPPPSPPTSPSLDAAASPLYSNLRRLSAHAWTTVEQYQHKAGEGAVKVQAECVSANKLAFWLEDVHTPGYDSLLKRREAELRRAKACKLAALIAATFGVILVIAVPICALKA